VRKSFALFFSANRKDDVKDDVEDDVEDEE
jgi:hypothetical protein